MPKPLVFQNFAITSSNTTGDPGRYFPVHCIMHGEKGLGFVICDSHKLSDLSQDHDFSCTVT